MTPSPPSIGHAQRESRRFPIANPDFVSPTPARRDQRRQQAQAVSPPPSTQPADRKHRRHPSPSTATAPSLTQQRGALHTPYLSSTHLPSPSSTSFDSNEPLAPNLQPARLPSTRVQPPLPSPRQTSRNTNSLPLRCLPASTLQPHFPRHDVSLPSPQPPLHTHTATTPPLLHSPPPCAVHRPVQNPPARTLRTATARRHRARQTTSSPR